MEASVRLFNSANRHLSRSLLTSHSHSHSHSLLNFPPKPSYSSSSSSSNPNLSISFSPNLILILQSNLSSRIRCSSSSFRSSYPTSWDSNPLGFLQLSHPFSSIASTEPLSDSTENYFSWHRASEAVNGRGGDLGFGGGKRTVFTVVLLGWLGAEQKHLRRYVELYNSRGIHAVTFVIPVKDMLGIDLGRRVEKRIRLLAEELATWVSESEEDGRDRCLLFHTFSNTGWLVYGTILDYLQSRGDFVSKIRGCVIDSGADPEINHRVWAAGFSAALLKKRSSATLPSVGVIDGQYFQNDEDATKVPENEPHLIETLLQSVLEKLFSFLLRLPDVNRRLTKIISVLTKNQPPCPQLYLYSTADKVIPFRSVEMFIQDQKMAGKKVRAYNFGLSPHVDHYRSFPHLYSTELFKFLEECVTSDSQK